MCTKQSLLVFFIILNVFLQLSENGERLSLLSGFSIIGLRSAGGCGFRKLLCLGSGDYGEGRLHPTLGPTVDGLRISAPIIPKTQSTTPPPSPFPPPSPSPSPSPPPSPPPLPPKVRAKKGSSECSQSQIPSFPLSLPYEETTPGSGTGQYTGNGSKGPSNRDGCLGRRPNNSVSPSPPRAPSLYDNVSDGNGDPMDGAPKKPPLPANWRLPLGNKSHNGAHHHHHQHQHHHHHHHHQNDCSDSGRPPQKPHLPEGFRLRK
ncbi:putative signal peptide-containing secreted [Cryptosporidium hominis]